MIDLRNVMSPIESANGLPNACYIGDDMFGHERETLFRDSWARSASARTFHPAW